MTIDDKLTLNKLIRKYDSTNSYIVSLQKTLKSNYIPKIEYNGKFIKLLTDKQYEIAKSILNL
jgi:hypothetical protein